MLPSHTGQLRVAQMQKSLKNKKVLILGLVFILVMIYSTLVEKDLSAFQSHIPGCGNHNRVAEELKDSSSDNSESAESNNPLMFNSVNITKFLAEDDSEEKKESDKPYSLGPKISDWDEQRGKWLKDNPEFPSFIRPNKPRVLLVTGSSPKPCENQMGDHYLLKFFKNKVDYCRIHGIEIFYNTALLDAEMSGFWAKLPLIRELLLSHPEVEFLWWMDSDAMFTDMKFEVPWEKYEDVNMIMQGWSEVVYEKRSWVGLNTGSFLLRNNQWALDLLDAWVPMGPKGKIRDEAGKFLTKELSERPLFEADDQSALVYMLVSQRDKWSSKVYLEHTYLLSGWWFDYTEKYEEMIEKYHPGFGDSRWPFITHFTGCKPCGKLSNYPAENVLKQMDRAFTFADDQILQMYGFRHKSLGSRKVVRKRKKTSKPLDIKDELGLLHPSFTALNSSSLS